MTINYNIMMFICEDDDKLRSSFFLDLYGLLEKNSNIPINIIYHSLNYYGSQYIKIEKDTYTASKISKINLTYRNIKKGIHEMYKEFYVKGKKNILYYGGHARWIFQDKDYLKTNLFENINGIELIILDTCYGAYVNLLSTIIDKTKYVMACCTSSPTLGFIVKDFIKVLNIKQLNDIEKYKKLIDLFIKRNSSNNMLYKEFNYRTDGSLIDMKKYVNVYEYIKNNYIKKDYKCKIEKIAEYYYYDLLCIANNTEMKNFIKDCVLYKKINKLAREFFNKHGISLSGLVIGIK